MITDKSYSLKDLLAKEKIPTPDLHVVLGSGLAPAFGDLKEVPAGFQLLKEIPFGKVAGLVPSTAPGHKGMFRFYQHSKSGKVLTFQVGRLHGFEGHSPQDVVQPLVQSCLAGCKDFILNNAAGSLNPKFTPGTLMMIRDLVNLTGKSPLTGPNPVDPRTGKNPGPRFVDMSEALDKKYGDSLKSHLSSQFTVNDGTYLGVNGPTFETPAEIRLFNSWGLGSVGMSTVWEIQALRYFGARMAAFSLISNMGCGLVSSQPLSHEEVEDEAKKVAPKLLRLLFEFAAK